MDIDFWIKNNLNVLWIGEAGTGKTARIKEAFDRHFGEQNKDWLYFSGATMDPWVDFIGVPKERKSGNQTYLDFVRPQSIEAGNVQAIYIDEYNRAHKKVRNAVMELIQFKSINGKKFPNLRVVWAAINPCDDNETYDVERLDPAQQDRFHVHYKVPYEPDYEYFKNKFGAKLAKPAIKHWKDAPNEVKSMVSPRRLDYALEIHLLGGSIRDTVLPHQFNVGAFLESICGVQHLEDFKKMIKEDVSQEEIAKWLLNDTHYNTSIEYIREHEELINYLPNERLSQLFETDKKIQAFIANNPDKFQFIVQEKEDINP